MKERNWIVVTAIGATLLTCLFMRTMAPLNAQPSTTITGGSSLPSNCSAGHSIYIKTSATAGVYWCPTTDTWQIIALPFTDPGADKLIYWDDTNSIPASVTLSAAFGFTSGAFSLANTKRLTSTVANATTSYADVTGLTWTVAASTDYAFDCFIPYISSSASTVGQISINGPASPTLMIYVAQKAKNGVNSLESKPQVAYDTDASTTTDTASSTIDVYTVHGTLRNGSTSGTLALRLKAGTTGTMTVQSGAFCTFK